MPTESQHGEAKNSWLTGTAAWNFVAIINILGIRPELNGLRIKPVVPKDWKEFSAERIFRGVRYVINVKRIGDGNNCSLIVDGIRIDDSVVPLPKKGMDIVNIQVEIM